LKPNGAFSARRLRRLAWSPRIERHGKSEFPARRRTRPCFLPGASRPPCSQVVPRNPLRALVMSRHGYRGGPTDIFCSFSCMHLSRGMIETHNVGGRLLVSPETCVPPHPDARHDCRCGRVINHTTCQSVGLQLFGWYPGAALVMFCCLLNHCFGGGSDPGE
jgi:hypothetical protein